MQEGFPQECREATSGVTPSRSASGIEGQSTAGVASAVKEQSTQSGRDIGSRPNRETFHSPSLASKIVAIMREVSHVERNGTSDSGDFAFQTPSDILHAIRPKLLAHNIALISNEQECEEGKFKRKGVDQHTARVKTLYTLIDGDSGERESFSIFAAAHSDNTPAVNSAKTSSLKYALKQTFLIPDEPPPEQQATPAEKNRAALDKVKATSAAGNLLTIKLLSAKPQISSHKSREFLALSYCLVGKPRERKYASCWVDPLKPLLAASVGQDMLVKIETSTEGGKVYTNFVNAFKIGEREVEDFKFVDEAAQPADVHHGDTETRRKDGNQ